MTVIPEMADHPFYGPGAAVEVCGDRADRAEAVLFDEFEEIFEPLLIRTEIHVFQIKLMI